MAFSQPERKSLSSFVTRMQLDKTEKLYFNDVKKQRKLQEKKEAEILNRRKQELGIFETEIKIPNSRKTKSMKKIEAKKEYFYQTVVTK